MWFLCFEGRPVHLLLNLVWLNGQNVRKKCVITTISFVVFSIIPSRVCHPEVRARFCHTSGFESIVHISSFQFSLFFAPFLKLLWLVLAVWAAGSFVPSAVFFYSVPGYQLALVLCERFPLGGTPSVRSRLGVQTAHLCPGCGSWLVALSLQTFVFHLSSFSLFSPYRCGVVLDFCVVTYIRSYLCLLFGAARTWIGGCNPCITTSLCAVSSTL